MNTPNESKRPSDASIAKAVREADEKKHHRAAACLLAGLMERAYDLDAAQPAQAGEAVVPFDYIYEWDCGGHVHRSLDHAPYNGRRCNRVHAVYLHPQPEQPASAVCERLVYVGDQLPGETAKLIAHLREREESHVSPAVSPPSVVAVSEEDVKVALTAFGEAARRMPDYATIGDPEFSIVAPFMRAALESFAQRMGSGERDAWLPIESAPKDGREVLLRVAMRAGIPGRCLVGHYMAGGHCIEDHPPIDAGWYFWNGLMFDQAAQPIEWSPIPRAAIAQRSDKRGGA